MDTRAMRELIRQSLTVPPTVRTWTWDPPSCGAASEQTQTTGSCSVEATTSSASTRPAPARPASGELWQVSFKDLTSPAADAAKPGPSHPSTPDSSRVGSSRVDSSGSSRPGSPATTKTGPSQSPRTGPAAAGADAPRAAQPTSEDTSSDASTGTCGDPADRLRAALVDLGVQDFIVDALTETALACATVATTLPAQYHTSQAHTTRDDTTRDDTSQGGAAEGRAGQDQAGPQGGEESEEHAKRPERRGRLGVDRGDALLGAILTLTTTAGKLDSVLLSATSGLTADIGQVLLNDKGFATPQELSKTQRQLWRRRAKNLTRREICAATGWGEGETTDLVALANTPHSVLAQVHDSLRAGETTWRLARSYYRNTASMEVSDAAAIAASLFGTDPDNSVTERLNSSGAFHGHPWWHKEYYRALNREVTQVKGRDPESVKKTRENNVASNDVHLNVDEHGTGCLMIGTTATQGAAMLDRITKAAKAARAAGDTRTLRQLRVATATALLLHGTADLPDLPEDPALITTEQSAQLNKILYALPTAELNVIVPLNTLLGTTPDHLTPTDTNGTPIPAAFTNTPTPNHSTLPRPTGTTTPECTCTCTCAATPPPDPARPGQDRPTPHPTPDSRQPTGPDCPDPGHPRRTQQPAGEIGIAEVVGTRSIFLTPDEARTLALTPGSTLYRLLTDPATGTLIERSTTAYRFDGPMRAHIIAADVFCRAPGCLRPATMAQIDHVQEYGTPGGHTCITNGQPLDAPHHDLKTKNHWDAVLHANRDVTWTTLLGRIYTTKTHDYTQYTRLLTEATQAVKDATTQGTDPTTAIDHQIYQALTYRPSGSNLEADDDIFHSDEQFTGWDQVTTTHTRADGKRSYHPHPHTAQAEHDRIHRTTHNPTQTDRAATPWDTTTNTDDPPF